ncbi:MAG TPA: transglycosylase SLT domain-containing protein [Acidimicrobiales bacterium]|nr:transglycosylase SLT domain-containing protein [Acidimicrobiales bacterium]
MTAPATPAPAGSVVAAIEAAAAHYGVDPRLALADAQQESGLNPTSVGDGGTSFGLYQLHQGGELGNLSPAQAFDPTTNADTALAVFAQVQARTPGASPGQIAALAERPANPSAYAASVNAIYGNPNFMPGVAGTAVTPASSTPTPTSSSADPASQPATATLTGITSAFDPAAWQKLLIKLAFVAAGLALVGLGLARLFPGITRTITTTATRMPVPIPA